MRFSILMVKYEYMQLVMGASMYIPFLDMYV